MNSLRVDPTRTTMLRKQFMSEMTRPFRELNKVVKKLLVEEDAFGLRMRKSFLSLNTRWQFETDAKKVDKFEEWLQEQIDNKIIGIRQKQVLTDRFIKNGYLKGAKRAYGDVRRNSTIFSGEAHTAAQDEFFRISPIDVERLAALQARTFRDLKGVTKVMADQMTRILSEGLLRGEDPETMAQRMADRIEKIGITRARVIARTEVIRAHAEGALDAMERLGVEEIRVNVEWRTAGDMKVCPLCAPLQGVILTVKQARGMFPRHPNCRCSPVPVKKRNKRLTPVRTRKAIDASVMAEIPEKKRSRRKSVKQQRRRSRWVGAR